jgi:hypothetical protein
MENLGLVLSLSLLFLRPPRCYTVVLSIGVDGGIGVGSIPLVPSPLLTDIADKRQQLQPQRRTSRFALPPRTRIFLPLHSLLLFVAMLYISEKLEVWGPSSGSTSIIVALRNSEAKQKREVVHHSNDNVRQLSMVPSLKRMVFSEESSASAFGPSF